MDERQRDLMQHEKARHPPQRRHARAMHRHLVPLRTTSLAALPMPMPPQTTIMPTCARTSSLIGETERPATIRRKEGGGGRLT